MLAAILMALSSNTTATASPPSQRSTTAAPTTIFMGHDTDVNGVGTLLNVGWNADPFPTNTTAPSVGLRFEFNRNDDASSGESSGRKRGGVGVGSAGGNVTLDFVYTTYSTTTRPLQVTSVFNMASDVFCNQAVNAIDWSCAPKLAAGSLCSPEMEELLMRNDEKETVNPTLHQGIDAPPATVLHLKNAPRVGETNVNYASWTIDSSYNRGFVHTDFTNQNLLAAAKTLQPSTIRFGGGGNDYLQYNAFQPCNSSTDGDKTVCLNDTQWDALYNMANNSGSAFLFGLSFDFVKACRDKGSYVWQPDAAVAMIKHIQRQGQTMWGYELGNEVNNRHDSCNMEPAIQAAAFIKLKAALADLYPDTDARPRLIGPDIGCGSSKFPPKEYLAQFLGNFSELHAVTYHVYSWLSKRNYDFAMPIDNAVRDGEGWYPGMVKDLAPGAELWAGEDGPISGGEDGTCGGKYPNGTSTNRSVCGTYATVPWYANDLAGRALIGFKQYQRQDLIGGRYGLLGIPHDGEALGATDPLKIHSDFWVMFMWKRLMGTDVYDVNSTAVTKDPDVRVYGHCGVPPSPHAYIVDRAAKGSHEAAAIEINAFTPEAVSSPATQMGLLLININTTSSRKVMLSNGGDTGGSTFTSWTLTAGADGVFGETPLLNGKPLPVTISNGIEIGKIPVKGIVVDDGALELPPFSVTFVATTCWPTNR